MRRSGKLKIYAEAVLFALAGLAGCGWKGIEIQESNLVSPNGAITQAGDEARTGWYPDQPGLDPAIVGGANFGRLFKTPLPLTPGEQVLAQPLVYNGKVLVATESNNLYLLDAVTGAITNSRALGAAYNASGMLGCGDIQPTTGITGTPVIDTSSNTAYFFSKSDTGVWTFHAVDAGTLAERAGFPVTIAGTAQNEPTQTFNAATQHQRPGLLLMNGVVYAGFGAHCDIGAYRGWIVGVSTTGEIKALFSTVKGAGANGRGAGVWMSGGGLSSDGAGQILFSTGNAYNGNVYPSPIPTNTDPGPLVEAVARLTVQADGTLKTTDAFIPFNWASLDGGDADLGSGGVVSLPAQFGTASVPHLAMVSGKGGTFYLLNRDHLGGHKQGASGGDAVLAAVDLGGATWNRPAAWPGDGGYMYVMTNGGTSTTGFRLQAIKYGTDAQGLPTATIVARAPEDFGSYSGSPIVTSNGTASGSALVWATNNTSELRVYDAVPVAGNLTLRFHDAYGSQAKFTTVGVGAGRVYVGSGDGYVIGYGSTSLPPVSGGPVDFGTVVIGQGATVDVTLTANQNMTVTGFSTTNAAFAAGASTPALPNAMTASQTMTVPVTFTPTASGNATANLTVTTSAGTALVTLTGVGQVNGPQLVATPATVNFGGVATGTSKSLPVVLQNAGNQTLTFGASPGPAAPFSATGVPASGATLAAGASVTATVTFSPTTDGTWMGTLGVNSDGGNVSVALAATSGAPPLIQITPLALDYGQLATGAAGVLTFAVKNVGGTDLTITKSKPPALGPFVATTTLAEGSVITAGQTVTESVTFSSATAGTFNDVWVITGNDTTGVQNVAFTATAVAALSRAGWVATASTAGGDAPANALDGNIATRFSSGTAMVPGQWFQVDLQTAQTFSIVTMDSGGSAGDYAHGYQVLVSNDGVNFGSPVAQGTGSTQLITVSFPQQTARFVRIVQTATVTPNWWSIHEFNIYGTGGGTPPPPPQPPSALTAGNASSATIDLTWAASPTPGVSYSVFRGTTSGFAPGAGNLVISGLTGLAYTDTNLAASTTYYYVVEAIGAGGASTPSNQASATTQAGQTLTALSRTGWVPSAQPASATDTPAKAIDGLANTRFSSGTAQVNGQWFQVDMLSAQSFSRIVMDSTASANDYAHGYQVFVSNDGATWGTAVATGTGAAAVLTVNFAAQTKRFIRVVQTGAATSWWSIHEFDVYGGAAPPAPQPPTGLAATAASSTAINVSWTASTTSGVTYSVFRSTTAGFTAGAGNQIATGLGGLTYADSGLSPSTTYYYLAQANGTGGASASSNQASATTQPPPPPAAPTGLAATAASSTAINLSWTASTTSGVTYSVFRSTTAGFTAGAGNQIAAGLAGVTYASTGLAASTTYYYLVQAVNAGGSSPSSNQASATTLTPPPAAPTGLTATAASTTAINLSWTASTTSGVTYSVFRSTTSGFTAGAGNQIATGLGGLTYADSGLSPSTTYYYLVQAVNAGGSSPSSNQASATTLTPPPAAPTGLTATAASTTAINLSWTASTTSGVTYSVFRSTTSGFTAGAGNQIATGLAGLTYASTGLAASTTYYYLVQAVNAGGSSPSSNQASATTLTPPPAAPTGLTATAASTTAINLSWTASTTSGVTYSVFRSTTSGFTAGAGNQIATGLGGLTYADSGLSPSTTYYYLVQAVNAGGSSPSSNQASATTLTPPPAAPTGLTATAASTTAINLSWTASTTSGVTYSVFRSTTSGFTAGAGNQIATGLAGLTYASTGLAASTTYYYLVQAVNAGGSSPSSNQASATTLTPPPAAPTGLTATAASSTAINLSWTASTTSGVTYSVFRSTTSGFAASGANQIATGLGGLTYVDSGLTPSTTYYYLARANNGGGASVSSNQAGATTQAAGGAGPLLLSRTGWVATASLTGGTDTPVKSLDGDSATRWSTGAPQANGQWFQLDLGAAQTFDQLVMSSGADYARGYQVFVSSDGATWGTAVATGTGTGATISVSFALQTKRFVRVVQTGTSTSWWSIYEVNLWNNNGNPPPVAYARTGWVPTASSTGGADTPAKAVDGVTTTRWSSGAAQANGQWFQIDMGVAQPFVQVIMDSTGSGADYARGYQVFVSNDGATWGTAIASGTPTGPVVIVSFATQTKRYIRIVQTGTATAWWSMHEVNVTHY